MWFLLVISLIWSVMCWIEIYNRGCLISFATFITGAIFAEAIHALAHGDFIVAAINALPTVVILITSLILKYDARSQKAK